MYTCAECAAKSCQSEGHPDVPKNCTMHDERFMREVLQDYFEPDNHEFFKAASATEAKGYCVWPRLKETGEFCRHMRYERIGVAFCTGLLKEAKVITKVLRERYGLEVASVACKSGGIAKTDAGIPEEYHIEPGRHEAMCNPIAQAKLLNREKTQFNVVVGLCVGHDSLFFKYSDAPVTVLVAKDRVTGNNPAAAVYCADGYFKNRL